MKNYEEKMRRKTFWSVFGWVGRKENKWWNLGVFSPGPPKSFLPKIERKLKRKIGHYFLDKNSHVQVHMGLSTLFCFIFFFLFSIFFFFFPPGRWPRCFLPDPTKEFSPQNGEKIEGKNWTSFLDKNANVQLHMALPTLLFFFLFVLFFFFVFCFLCDFVFV